LGEAATVEQIKLIAGSNWAQSLIAVAIAFIAWRLSDAAITRFFARRFVSRFIPRVGTYASLTKSITGLIIAYILILSLLHIWKINIMPALWSAGVISVVLGFGAQAIVRDLLTGVFLLFEDTFDIGDGVELTTGNGVVSGTVEAINLRETRIVDGRGSLVSVPNGSIIFVANTTRLPTRVELSIRLPWRSGVASLREQITQLAEAGARSAGADPEHLVVRVEDMTPESVTFLISLQVPRQHAQRVASRVRESVAAKLQEEGLLPGAQPAGGGQRSTTPQRLI
jgi:small conductance mechanosensitive channel